MMKSLQSKYSTKLTMVLLAIFSCLNTYSQTLPTSIKMKNIPGATFTMGSNSLIGNPTQQSAAPEHQVTLSSYAISEAEITNEQYVSFLNAAYNNGLIEIVTGTQGLDAGKKIIIGTSNSSYEGKSLYSLEGTRVMKDHDDEDNDENYFTGVIEPENPLNISYIGFNEGANQFYLKNPHDTSDFNWYNLCNYYDYGATEGTWDTNLKNDFNDWSGSGQNLSNELQGWTANNPENAVNLPNQATIANWPVTFIRWWGAKAFANYYNMDLPTEAQWEYAAQAGQNYQYAVHDGSDITDANWNQTSLEVALHHVREAISGEANPFGLYNMAGNAWEWIADNYVAPYSTDAVNDPFIKANGSDLRCWRGGAWNYHQATLQSSIRFYDNEFKGNDHFGFRITGAYSTTGLLENNQNELFQLYPNPAENFIQINLNDNTVHNVLIYAIDGQLIKQLTAQGSATINLNEFETGSYLLKIGEHVEPFIIK